MCAEGDTYYVERAASIMALLKEHAAAWLPLLQGRWGDAEARAVVCAADGELERLIPLLPYIGGDANEMTRHLVRSSTSLALYLAMRRRGYAAMDTGWVVYHAVRERVSALPAVQFGGFSEAERLEKRRLAALSQERRYAGDWVWRFVEGPGEEYGYDFLECGTQKLYAAHEALDFLPYYCYLDFVTHRLAGWQFARTTTLAQGGDCCDFRWRRGEAQVAGWPPRW